jgi:hypothetical protein
MASGQILRIRKECWARILRVLTIVIGAVRFLFGSVSAKVCGEGLTMCTEGVIVVLDLLSLETWMISHLHLMAVDSICEPEVFDLARDLPIVSLICGSLD